MTTKDDVIRRFHTEFMSPTTLPSGLEVEWLKKAIGDFEEELYSLDFDEESESFTSKLKQSEISMLSRLMYKYYLKRDLDRILKLNNIVGKDLSLNAMGQAKAETRMTYEKWCFEIDKYLNKFKENSFL